MENLLPTPPAETGDELIPPSTGGYDDQELLDIWKEIQRECLDDNWIFHRQWQRNLWYILGRQWIDYNRYGGWRDKRMAAWIPRPVTNKCKETVQAIRAMFTSIKLSVNVRPNGADPKNVSAAATADELGPLLHESHLMNTAMSEFDFWLCSTGNAFIHTYVDYDVRHGYTVITAEQCVGCGTVSPSNELAGAQPVCPTCQGTEFIPAVDPTTGAPIEDRKVKGVPATIVLSPLEIAFRQSYTRFDELPEIVRSRWRTKRYFENHPTLKALVPKIVWQKAPQGQNLALLTTLGQSNDLGITSNSWSEGPGRGGELSEGVPEHEVWMKPCDAYPDGLVFRIVGDKNPIVLHLEDEEAIPGPLPYKDADGAPIFPFAHATFEHVGGRILGSGPLDVIIGKQDHLNQLDSYILLCLGRTANPIWTEPKGCEVQKLTGMPGLVVKYKTDPMNPSSKPERLPGIPLDASWMALREQYIRDIEELAGTFDVIKGQKPAGVEAFSALQLLVERSQARFASVFQSRGDAYKNWFKFAIELEREFGPDERTKAVLTPARTWTFETFKRANLSGSISTVVEDGSTTPKTSLGMRASVEHAVTLGILNFQDPDQRAAGLALFGLLRMAPSLDIHMQAALQKQQEFETWVVQPGAVEQFVASAQQQQMQYQQQVDTFGAEQEAQSAELSNSGADPSNPMPKPVAAPPPPPSMLVGTPLKWKPWYDVTIHMQEFLKWANDDHIRELIAQLPIVENMLELHMQDMQGALAALMPPPGMEGPSPAQGGGKAMSNSNGNSAPAGNKPQPEAGKA